MQAYALPLSGESLKDLTGLTNVGHADIDAWSQAMIDGIANFIGAPLVEARCNVATAAIDAAIDDACRRGPRDEFSLLSVMSKAECRPPARECAPQHQAHDRWPERAAEGDRWRHLGLLTHPQHLAEVRQGRLAWTQVPCGASLSGRGRAERSKSSNGPGEGALYDEHDSLPVRGRQVCSMSALQRKPTRRQDQTGAGARTGGTAGVHQQADSERSELFADAKGRIDRNHVYGQRPNNGPSHRSSGARRVHTA